MNNYRDGEVHQVGPFRLQYVTTTNADTPEQGKCWIRTEGDTSFLLDFAYAEALAVAIERFPDLFSAVESDKGKLNSEGMRRGFLRLRASQDTKRHGIIAAASQNEVYQLARIVMNAKEGEQVVPIDFTDEGRRDYRRQNLRIEPLWGAQADTRHAFIQAIHHRVMKLDGAEEADTLRKRLLTMFALADGETGSPDTITYEPKGRTAA